jgi:dTDP-4-dehydrorhamnose 3,5-epimerase
MEEPILYEGGISIDDRGQLSFINKELNIKRFYIVTNHKSHFIRAWHAHKKEAKYVTVVQGSAIIGIIEIDDWAFPAQDLEPDRYILSANKPQLLYIPAGYANGFMNLTQDTILQFFSTSTLEESKSDDNRFPYNYFSKNFWTIKNR